MLLHKVPNQYKVIWSLRLSLTELLLCMLEETLSFVALHFTPLLHYCLEESPWPRSTSCSIKKCVQPGEQPDRRESHSFLSLPCVSLPTTLACHLSSPHTFDSFCFTTAGSVSSVSLNCSSVYVHVTFKEPVLI